MFHTTELLILSVPIVPVGLDCKFININYFMVLHSKCMCTFKIDIRKKIEKDFVVLFIYILNLFISNEIFIMLSIKKKKKVQMNFS